MPEKLILSFRTHPKFGSILQVFFAEYDSDTDFYAILEPAKSALPAYKTLDAREQKIVLLAEKLSDQRLMKAYSRESTVNAFLEKITADKINFFIRPFIEGRHKEILQLAADTLTPLFRHEKSGDRSFAGSQKIVVLPEKSRFQFHFSQSEIFTYSIRVKNGDNVVELFGKKYDELCLKPAVCAIGNELHFFEDVDVKKLRPFFTKKQIEVPARSVNEYIRKFVVKCIQEFDVEVEGVDLAELQPKPRAVLVLETNLQSQVALHLQFIYGKHVFEVDTPYRKVVETTQKGSHLALRYFQRDEIWEKSCVKLLTDSGLKNSQTYHFTLKNESEDTTYQYGILEWINQHQSRLSDFEIAQTFGKIRYFTGEISLKMGVQRHPDWFDMRCTVMFGELAVPFTKLRNHILNNRCEYILPDESIAILPQEWFERFANVFRFGSGGNDTNDVLRLKSHHFQVVEMAEKGTMSDVKRDFETFPKTPPEKLNATLRPYQIVGYRWMLYLQSNGFGGCLADDMGLGKTLQTIAILLQVYDNQSVDDTETAEVTPANLPPAQLSLFHDQTIHANRPPAALPPSLIVVPTSLVHNWANELQKFAPSLAVYVHTGANRLKDNEFKKEIKKYQIVLTTYSIVRLDIEILQHAHFQYIVLDESHYIKNPASQTFQCVTQLQSHYRLALTGTPVENSLTDLWAQMEFLNPGILGSLSSFQKLFLRDDFTQNNAMKQSLLKIVGAYILRRTKREVAPELPPLTEEICYCEMSGEQAELYRTERNKVRNALIDGVGKLHGGLGIHALQSLTQLRLLANHPVLQQPEYAGESAKFSQVVEYAEMIMSEGHKILIFSSFVKHLRLFAGYYEERNWNYAWLTGATADREKEIARFNSDPAVQTFFISLKAGGVGLNLTEADYVFILDPWWNPFAERQAVSRAHRIGQEKKVTLYRFITQGTVEEKICRLQDFKIEISDAVVKEKMTGQELEALLGD